MNLPSVADEWEKGRANIINTNKSLYDRIYFEHEKKTILKDIINWGINTGNRINIEKFPALRIMAYSQYSRVHKTGKAIKPNDVMDVLISSAVPYVDAVMTENFQADVYKKAKKHIKQLKDLEVLNKAPVPGKGPKNYMFKK